MGLEDRLKRLEETGQFGGTLTLPDGTKVRYGPGEPLDAFFAVIEGREHRLLPYLRQIPTTEGMAGLVQAIEGDDGA